MPLLALGAIGVVFGDIGTSPLYALKEVVGPAHPLCFADPPLTSFIALGAVDLGRETVIPTTAPGMVPWREHLFAWMTRNAASANDFFRIPANRVVELGSQIEI